MQENSLDSQHHLSGIGDCLYFYKLITIVLGGAKPRIQMVPLQNSVGGGDTHSDRATVSITQLMLPNSLTTESRAL